jgi:hypothetical protein
MTMGIRIDFTFEKYNGEKLNNVEKYELEKKINLAISQCIDNVIKETVPSYIKYKGHHRKLVGHNKHVAFVLK